tara:strand:- start:940 stop:1836 length:897 start_codon:yes stop_codon:yes gene_type:complete
MLAQLLFLGGCEKSMDEDLLTLAEDKECDCNKAYVTETKDPYTGSVYKKSLGGEKTNIRHYKNGLMTGLNTLDGITGDFKEGKRIGAHTRKIITADVFDGKPDHLVHDLNSEIVNNKEIVLEWIYNKEGYLLKGPVGYRAYDGYWSGYATYYSPEEIRDYYDSLNETEQNNALESGVFRHRSRHFNKPVNKHGTGNTLGIVGYIKAVSFVDWYGHYEEFYINGAQKLERGSCDWNCSEGDWRISGHMFVTRLDRKINKGHEAYNRRSCFTKRYLTDDGRRDSKATEEIVLGACEITEL